MLYQTVEITALHGKKPKWVWGVRRIEGEREDVYHALPNDLGYYHFPRSWPAAKGFRILRAAMVRRHKREILRLQRSLKLLYKLSGPLK